MTTHPTVPARAAAVLGRSLLATGEVIGFAAFAHEQAGGTLPPPQQLALLSAITFAAAFAVLAGRVRIRVVAPLVMAFQVVLHEGFSRLATLPTGQSHGAMAGMAGTAMVRHHALDLRMIGAHTAIGLITLLVLVVQEKALQQFAALVQILVARQPLALPRLNAVPSGLRIARALAQLLDTSPRRGPPYAALLTS
ncbi:MAG: hypothetical protein JWP74_2570 [Marmoricola sp.]|nr:hypothetical protein [Marmoricola sp.]